MMEEPELLKALRNKARAVSWEGRRLGREKGLTSKFCFVAKPTYSDQQHAQGKKNEGTADSPERGSKFSLIVDKEGDSDLEL